MRPGVGVVVPTFNRCRSLARTLESLETQRLGDAELEVLVVDDGSTDDTATVAQLPRACRTRYLRQARAGATAARNRGACASAGDVLVFVDDDVTVGASALEALWRACAREQRAIVLGELLEARPVDAHCPAPSSAGVTPPPAAAPATVDVPFVECKTGLLAIKRADFFAVGMFQDPTGGWPSWDDVAFGFRAVQAGYRIVRSPEARGLHHDEAAPDLSSAAARQYRAGWSAATLFEKYPAIRPALPMFRDQCPVWWGHDPPALVARKLARPIASTRPVLRALAAGAWMSDRAGAPGWLCRALRRWVLGGHLHRGYRDGHRERLRAAGRGRT